MRCKHENIKFVETIPAYHMRIFEGDEYFKNNEYGMQCLGVHVQCYQCGLTRIITNKNQDKQPSWVRRRIEILKDKDEWFL